VSYHSISPQGDDDVTITPWEETDLGNNKDFEVGSNSGSGLCDAFSAENIKVLEKHQIPEAEEDDRKSHPTKSPASVGKKTRKRGRRRRGRSMGRFPWTTYSKLLIEERRDWSRTREGTVQAMERRLRYIGRIVQDLKDQGRLSTTNPAKLTEKDIGELFRYFKEERGLKPPTLQKYLNTVNQVTAIAGNPVVMTMRQHPVKRQQLPKRTSKAAKRSFTLETVLTFLDATKIQAENLDEWWYVARYGFAAFFAGFGLRQKELRAARLRDLEIHCWRLRVDHAKTEPDYVSLLPPFEGHVLRFLELRKKAFEARGLDPGAGNTLIIPYLPTPGTRDIGLEGFTGSQVRTMFTELRQATGIPISPKDLRTSFGQILMDAGASMDECSAQLRHASVSTTQKWYVDLRSEDTYNRLQDLFSRKEKPKSIPP
jgi:integrase